MDALGTKDVAERLSVHPNTIALWQDKIGFQVETDSRGRKKFPPELVSTLEHIKALREEDAGYATIRRKLSLDDVPPQEGNMQPQEQASGDALAAQQSPIAHPSPEVMRLLDMVSEKDRQLAELQEKLLNVSSIAAQYQERSTNLATEIGKKDAEIKLLCAPKEEVTTRSGWRWPWSK